MRRERGFSLVELMMALAVLTVVILTTLAVFTERTRRMAQSTETMLAWQVIANEAEVWRRTSYSRLVPSEGPEEVEFSSSTDALKPLRPFKTKVHVHRRREGLKEVTLSITWKQGKREAKVMLIRTDTGGTNLW
jgi:prepilin-type N-terminal cleavage/methylation domain-containing protein